MELQQVIKDAIRLLNSKKISFLLNASPLLCVFIFLGLIDYVYKFTETFEKSGQQVNSAIMPYLFLCFLLVALVLAKTAVNSHRTFILNEKVSFLQLFIFSMRDLRFIFKFMIIFILITLINIPLITILGLLFAESVINNQNETMLQVFGLAINLLSAYVWSRTSLVLPATAIDDNIDISTAWRLSRQYRTQLFLGVGLLPIITNALISSLPEIDSPFYTVFTSALWVIVAIVELGILSLMYKHISASNIDSRVTESF